MGPVTLVPRGLEPLSVAAPRLTTTLPGASEFRTLLSLSTCVEPDTLQECFPETCEEEAPSPVVSFPTSRRVHRRRVPSPAETPDDQVERWFEDSGIQLGPLVPPELVPEVKRTFFAWRDLNATTVKDIPPTDLIVHRVRLKPGVLPWNRSRRKHWSPGRQYWLNKLVQEGIDAGMFESTVAANGSLSDWSAEPNLVDKFEGATEWDEPRLTLNYSNVEENMPGINITYLRDVYTHLSYPSIGCFSTFDLKHAYWTVSVHPDDRHVFAFEVPGFPQLQPTRMPQGSQTSGFTFTELMKLALGPVPPP